MIPKNNTSLQIKFRSMLENKLIFPILLLLLSFVSYGLLSPWMKFFHDEYSILWFYTHANDVTLFFEGNRPLLAYTYLPLLKLFGSNSLLWAAFSIFSRWLHAYSIYCLAQELWQREPLAILSAFLCLVYPAFQAQFASMLFSILFLLFSLFVFSLFLTSTAINNNKHRNLLHILSLILSLVSLSTSEYFFVLEILRYLIIWQIIRKKYPRNFFKRFSLTSLPYFIVFLCMGVWCYFQQSSETTYDFSAINTFSIFSIENVLAFVGDKLHDIWKTTFGAWIYAFYPTHILENQSRIVLFLALAIGIITVFGLFAFFWVKIQQAKKNTLSNRDVILFSVAALLLAGIPFWIANLPIGEHFTFSRWTIPFMIGASVITALIILSFNNRKLAAGIAAILIGVCAGNQILYANSFRQDWNKQMDYIWQFKWRIPSLQENSTIFSNMLNFDYENSDEISMALNLAYPSRENKNIPFFQFFLPERIDTALLPAIQPGIPLEGRRYYRLFKGNTSQVIVVDFQHPACLKVLDPEIDIYNPNLDDISKEALQLANLELIAPSTIDGNTKEILSIFSKQPDNDWCFYFEKADLARQFNKWDAISEIGKTVSDLELSPRDNREWLPFIEGYAHYGNWEQAVNLTAEIIENNPEYEEMLGALWNRIDEQTHASIEKENALKEIW